MARTLVVSATGSTSRDVEYINVCQVQRRLQGGRFWCTIFHRKTPLCVWGLIDSVLHIRCSIGNYPLDNDQGNSYKPPCISTCQGARRQHPWLPKVPSCSSRPDCRTVHNLGLSPWSALDASTQENCALSVFPGNKSDFTSLMKACRPRALFC